ncbi:unnamed protein product [Blepharisma stoltei]|uniref:Uncharacterized protein n=1 Tax=Blepharisma stoltei TaxID=1481888 RepID=A0AAU9K0Z6_9CILI|nr:unnamed protein product [Blepharisma stoltei]
MIKSLPRSSLTLWTHFSMLLKLESREISKIMIAASQSLIYSGISGLSSWSDDVSNNRKENFLPLIGIVLNRISGPKWLLGTCPNSLYTYW